MMIIVLEDCFKVFETINKEFLNENESKSLDRKNDFNNDSEVRNNKIKIRYYKRQIKI